MSSDDAERRELERAVELIGERTRPGRLLAYLGGKYFQQQGTHLTEFAIAADVFGRSPNNFDSTQDAVVRVEAHRLRKKLREIYEKGHGPHGLQIVLPAGSYDIKFLPVSEPVPAADLAEHPETAADALTVGAPAPPPEPIAARRIPRVPLYVGAALGLAIVVSVVLSLMGERHGGRSSAAGSGATSTATSSGAAESKVAEIHLLSGYRGSDVIDNSGVRWTPDRFYSGGGEWARNGGYIRGTARQFLFANWRSGQFEYHLPTQPGSYELRLLFVATQSVGDEKIASFNVSLNGKPLLGAYDPNISAFGADIADERVFRDVTPAPDGYIHLGFMNEVAIPALNALELVPGEPGRQRPIRIITQPTSFVDHKGNRWTADDYYVNGFRSFNRVTVSGTEDPELFAGERFGHFSYALPVDTRGRYTVVLHFAEFYFGPRLQGGGGVGSRVFHVFCNGQTLLQDFDIFKEVGSLKVVTKTFPNIRPSAQGKILLTFEPVTNNATVSGIEVIDESR